ncbi:hypothetical protein BN1723_005560 [Verticillium longisporum]|uniref:Uncharacterized protein n=1 Tax=Verticillium longisporum TaxID=100787 RepID=A0A0G4NA35_VERLO|nr:hypothetical protein BN1723_005560 [Verticillium longisporum]
MCIQIYTLHVSCDHHQYQNTFPCRSARGHNLGHPTRDLTLHHTKHLPASPPSESELAMCTGELRNATRPVEGTCQACVRKAREKRGQKGRRRDNTMTDVRTSIAGFEDILARLKM